MPTDTSQQRYRGDSAARARRRWRAEQRVLPREGLGMSEAYRRAIGERLQGPRSALELGIGTGRDLLQMTIQHRHVHWVGIDLSTGMLQLARQRSYPAMTSLLRAEGHYLPFRDAVFQLVAQKLAVSPLREVQRVLVPGGWYVDLTLGPDSWREVRRLFPRARDEWRLEARKLGFTRHAERLRRLGFTEVTRREWHVTEYYPHLADIVSTLLYAPIIEGFAAARDSGRLRALLARRTPEGLPITDHSVVVVGRRPYAVGPRA